MTTTTDEFLTTADLAQRWKVEPETLRQQRFRGEGPPYFKPLGKNGMVRYKLSDIIAYETERTTMTQSQEGA